MLEALILENVWGDAQSLIYSLGQSLDVSMHIPLAQAFLKLINWMIDPIYNGINFEISPSRHFKRQRQEDNSIPYDKNSSVQQAT